MAPSANDDMIVHLDAKWPKCSDDLFGQRDVLARRRGVAAWMIVDQNDGCRPQFERATCNFAHIDRRLIDRTLGNKLITYQHVARVEMENARTFIHSMRHRHVKVIG